MPRSLWEQALAPLRPQQRVWVARQVSDARLRDVAMALATEPTTLARALMLNGAASILREHAGSEHPNTVRRRTPGYP